MLLRSERYNGKLKDVVKIQWENFPARRPWITAKFPTSFQGGGAPLQQHCSELILFCLCSNVHSAFHSFVVGKMSTSITGDKLCMQRETSGAHPCRDFRYSLTIR